MARVNGFVVDDKESMLLLLKQKGNCDDPNYFSCDYGCPIYNQCIGDPIEAPEEIIKSVITWLSSMGVTEEDIFDGIL